MALCGVLERVVRMFPCNSRLSVALVKRSVYVGNTVLEQSAD